MSYEKVSETEVRLPAGQGEVVSLDNLKGKRDAKLRSIEILQAEIAELETQISEAEKLGVKTSSEIEAEKVAESEPVEE